jgi:hypothetical protein
LGLSEREAAADAWVGSWGLNAVLDCIVGGKPADEPDDRWRFELYPPGSWERVFASAA